MKILLSLLLLISISAQTYADDTLTAAEKRYFKSVIGNSGDYPESRKQFHERFADEIIKSTSPTRSPVAVFMAGTSGAGKSTTLRALQSRGILPFDSFVKIDPDEIATKIPEFVALAEKDRNHAFNLLRTEANDLSRIVYQKAIASKRSLIFDSTFMRGEQLLNELQQNQTYSLWLIHIETHPEHALQRVAKRHETEGRSVPERLVKSISEQLPEVVERLGHRFKGIIKIQNDTLPTLTSITADGVTNELKIPIQSSSEFCSQKIQHALIELTQPGISSEK
jgi:predicted ABC-type ATPase